MYEAIVIGASAGGLQALSTILAELPRDFALPILIVQHQVADADGFLPQYLDGISPLRVKEACHGEVIEGGTAYLSDPGYHLLVEEERTLSLSVDPPVNYSIPSIDVLFESAAEVFAEHLVGVILTGASADGTQGLRAIKDAGGLVVIQEPATAAVSAMPEAALKVVEADQRLPLEQIGTFLRSLSDE